MTGIIIGSILLSFLLLAYFFVIKPKREMARYAALLRSLGYNVYVYPFSLTSNSYVNGNVQGLKEHGDSFYSLKNEKLNVDVQIFNFINTVVLIAIHPNLIREILQPDKVDIYHKMSMAFRGSTSILGEGLLLTEGDTWRRHRRIVSKFFTHDLIKANISRISAICDKAFDELQDQSKTGDNQFSFYVKYLGEQLFGSVVLKCFIGLDHSKERIHGKRLPEYMIKLTDDISLNSRTFPVLLFGEYAYKFGLTKRIRDINSRAELYKKICKAMIQERRAVIQEKLSKDPSAECHDILEAMIAENYKGGKEKEVLTDEELFGELSTFFFAGTDTTAVLFEMMIYSLAENPEEQKKVRGIIDQVIKSDKDITADNLKALTYIDWVQNETLRMYQQISFTLNLFKIQTFPQIKIAAQSPANGIMVRKVMKDHLLLNIPITKGTGIYIQSIGNQYNEKYYKDPFIFKPERWESECNNLPNYALFGFSGGPRNCIGKNLSLVESKIALIKLLKRYSKIRLPEEKRMMHHKFMYEPVPKKLTFVKQSKKENFSL